VLWQKAKFNGKDVWVEVEAAGKPAAQAGRVAMRYQASEGARLYRGGVAKVSLSADAPVALPAGQEADAAPAAKAGKPSTRGSGFGSAGTRTAAQAAMAADAATKLLASLPAGTVVAFTDGSCRGNPGPAGAGAWVQLPDGRVAEVSRSLGRATNNVGELAAVGLALDVLEAAEIPAETPVALFTDSQYANGVLCKAWKAKANAELIADLRARLKLRPKLKVHWIAGHVGIAGNERADALANDGVAGRTLTRWL